MKLADIDLMTNLFEVRLFFQVEVDEATDAFYELGLWIAQQKIVWATAQTGAKSRVASSFGKCEEDYILLSRPARWTSRAAEDAGRANSVPEDSVILGVARLNGSPKYLFLIDQ